MKQVVEVDSLESVAWMRECIDLARTAARAGNYAVGALIAMPGGGVIARSGSGLVASDDPTAHPEIEVLRSAAAATASRYLPGAVMVSTLEPCVMCTGAAVWAKLGAIVYGATQSDALEWAEKHPDPVFTWRQILVSCKHVAARGEPVVDVHGGMLREECGELFALSSGKA